MDSAQGPKSTTARSSIAQKQIIVHLGDSTMLKDISRRSIQVLLKHLALGLWGHNQHNIRNRITSTNQGNSQRKTWTIFMAAHRDEALVQWRPLLDNLVARWLFNNRCTEPKTLKNKYR